MDFIEQEKENEKDFRFNDLILPVLQDFAELTAFVLVVEKNNEIMIVTFKNTHGFDITENCRHFRSLLVIANYIGMSLEDDGIILSLNFDCN